MSTTSSNKPHRIRMFLLMAITAGGAYVAGTKAGRERYKEMKAWLPGGNKEKLADQTQALREETAAALVETGAAVERRADRLGEALNEKAETAGGLAKGATKKTGEAVASTTAKAGRKILWGDSGPL